MTAVMFSCGTPGFLSSPITAAEVTEMAYFTQYSYIQLIEQGNQARSSDSQSRITRTLFNSLLVTNQRRFHLSGEIAVDTARQARVENEIAYLANAVFNRKQLTGITLTPVIDSLLESKNQRFGLAVV